MPVRRKSTKTIAVTLDAEMLQSIANEKRKAQEDNGTANPDPDFTEGGKYTLVEYSTILEAVFERIRARGHPLLAYEIRNEANYCIAHTMQVNHIAAGERLHVIVRDGPMMVGHQVPDSIAQLAAKVTRIFLTGRVYVMKDFDRDIEW